MEDDMEDSLKRLSSSKDAKQPDQVQVKPEFDKSANVKNELDGIFANIGKVTGMIN